MKSIIVAPVGDHLQDLYVAMRDFPPERVILIAPADSLHLADSARRSLSRFGIPAEIKKITGNVWDEMFRAVAEVSELYQGKSIIIHTSTGDRMASCAATSAAFVNGLKAIAVDGKEAMLLPVLKFSYYRLLTERKMQILRFMYQHNCCASLEELSRKLKMSLPLASYHINGNLKSDGLKDLGLAETVRENSKARIRLTILGRLLVKGYIS